MSSWPTHTPIPFEEIDLSAPVPAGMAWSFDYRRLPADNATVTEHDILTTEQYRPSRWPSRWWLVRQWRRIRPLPPLPLRTRYVRWRPMTGVLVPIPGFSTPANLIARPQQPEGDQ